jgi:hypothetical protein
MHKVLAAVRGAVDADDYYDAFTKICKGSQAARLPINTIAQIGCKADIIVPKEKILLRTYQANPDEAIVIEPGTLLCITVGDTIYPEYQSVFAIPYMLSSDVRALSLGQGKKHHSKRWFNVPLVPTSLSENQCTY